MHCSASQYSPYLSRPLQHPLPENGNAPSGTPCSVSTGYPWRSLTRFFGVSRGALQEQSPKSTETDLEITDSAKSIVPGARLLLARVNALLTKLRNR